MSTSTTEGQPKNQPFVYESGTVPADHPLHGCEPSNFCFNEVTDPVLLAEYEAMLDLEDRKDASSFFIQDHEKHGSE